jgi:two-component system, LytTR family, sensor kinase
LPIYELMNKTTYLGKLISRKEVLLFLLFYLISTVFYYTATWITWGGLDKEFISFFDLEEFFAAAGVDFTVSLFITIPIWYFTTISLNKYSHYVKLVVHVFFLPLYLIVCYCGQYEIKRFLGWAMFWSGEKAVWTYYNLLLFYVVQFSIIHAYNYFKRFKKEEKEKYALTEIALKSELLALKAQLSPHFLHNLFNSINATIPSENERTRELIIQLSDLFRYQNYAAKQEYVTLKEEIDFIGSYLELMKLRLKNRLNYDFEVPEELHGFKITPMLLQPLIENAINHGIVPNIEPASLSIKIKKEANKILFSIEDTGIGIVNKSAIFTKGIGLSNTKMRLEKIYNSSLKIEDNFPSGTKISFIL